MKYSVLSSLSALCLSLSVSAAPVWKVEKDGDAIFVGGTVHVLSDAQYPLPSVYDSAFNASDEVFFEADTRALKTPAGQQAMLQAMSYPDGGKITDDLSKTTVEKVSAHLQSRGVQLEQIASFKAGGLAAMLATIEYQLAGLVQKGVDEHYMQKAATAGKNLGWLETTESQFAVLANMGKGNEDAFINYTLESVSDAQQVIKDMLKAWESGDLDALDSMFVQPMQQDYPDIYHALLVERNAAWMDSVESMFGDDDREFVLVGMLHLAGENSLFDMLDDKGYTITELTQ